MQETPENLGAILLFETEASLSLVYRIWRRMQPTTKVTQV